MLFVSTTLLNNACRMEKDADVRERILLVRRVRVNNEIAAMVAEKEFHRSRWWAYKWLKRFDKLGLDGLKDKHRSGRPSEVSEETFAEIRRELSENSSGWKAYSYGNISDENGTNVNGDSIFDIGSITKTFTTTLLVDMVKRGLINLDDPIGKYLPDNVKVPTYNGEMITIENLATHTSGLPDFPIGWNRNQSYTNEQVYNFLSNITLQSEPGVFANYSDFGMGLLGHILAIDSGISYEKLVKDRILNVLGMDSTGIAMNSTGVTYPDILKSRLAIGHSGGQEVGLEFIPEALQPAGALYSTANDLMKYLSANVGLIKTKINDMLQETHLIRSEYQQPAAARATAELFSSNKSLSTSYVGLGWFVDTNLGTEIIQHSGSIDGYSSFMGFNPDNQVGLVQLCSCEGPDMPMEVRESLAAFITATLT